MCDSSYCFYEILADCEYEQGAEKVLLRDAGFSTNRRASQSFQRLERHCPRSSKYRSRLIPAVRRLFLMMNTGILRYFGTTTGRSTPAFIKIIWSPSSRTHLKPSRSKTHASNLY